MPVKDQASYAVIVTGLNQYGVESFTSYLYPFDTAMKASPYHYFELWMAAFVQAVCGFNPVLSLSGVAAAYTFFCLFCVVYPWMRPAGSGAMLRMAGIFSCLLFLAHRGFLHYFSESAAYWDSIFFDGNFKFIFLLPLFVLALERLLNGSKTEGIMLLLLLPVLNMVLLPVVLPAIAVFILFSWYSESGTIRMFKSIWFLLPLVLYLLLMTNHLLFQSSKGLMSAVHSIGGIAYNILHNGLEWTLLNSLLILLSGYLLYRKVSSKFIPPIVLIFILIASALLVRAVFDTNQNSFQIFSSVAFLAVFGLTLLLLRGYLSLFPQSSLYIYGLYFAFSIGMAIESYPSVQHVFSPRISAYSQPYLDSIATCRVTNPIGIRFVNGNTRTNLMKNPAYAGISDYFPLTQYLHSTVVMNVDELFPPPGEQSHHAESIRKEFMQHSVFIQKMHYKPNGNDTSMAHSTIRAFVQRYKPQFCIVEMDRELPMYLRHLISRKIYDPYSRETFYLLKPL